MKGPSEGYRAWLAKAKHDLLNIENNLIAGEIPWDTVCFHAQQAVEKHLKALLLFHGAKVPRTHDLVALLSLCLEFEPELADYEADGRKLTYFAVQSRYPDDLFEPDEQDGRAMYLAARRICSQIRDLLPG